MNKKNNNDKKSKISISLHPDILELVDKLSKKNKINKSKLIDNIIREYFKKEFNNE